MWSWGSVLERCWKEIGSMLQVTTECAEKHRCTWELQPTFLKRLPWPSGKFNKLLFLFSFFRGASEVLISKHTFGNKNSKNRYQTTSVHLFFLSFTWQEFFSSRLAFCWVIACLKNCIVGKAVELAVHSQVNILRFPEKVYHAYDSQSKCGGKRTSAQLTRG